MKQLLVSYEKALSQYEPIFSGIVIRWIKEELTDAGIDKSIFKTHN